MAEEKKTRNDAHLWKRAMSSPARDLEAMAERLDFFDLQSLPEYKKALETLQKFGVVSMAHIERYYQVMKKLEDINTTNKREFEMQRDYVIHNLEAIDAKYGDNYIAVHQCEVVDSDKNEFKLAKRVEAKYQKDYVMISRIKDILIPRTDYLKSPETEKE